MKNNFLFFSSELNALEGFKGQICYDYKLTSVSTATSPRSNSLIFITILTNEIEAKVRAVKECVIIVDKKFDNLKIDNNNIVFTDRPRKEFARALEFIMNKVKVVNKFSICDGGYYIGQNVTIGSGTIIEPFVVIGDDTSIGENCIIRTGVKIKGNCTIGDRCIIRENSVIGSDGFGFEQDDGGVTYRLPHLGGVKIGNNVEIGALTSIAQGTINPTIIDDYVKIDDNVFIAHNCFIGKGTFVIANAEVSGSVKIGKSSWIGPGVSIRNGITIGDNVLIGIGSVVVKDIENDVTCLGNPAKNIEYYEQLRKAQNQLVENYKYNYSK